MEPLANQLPRMLEPLVNTTDNTKNHLHKGTTTWIKEPLASIHKGAIYLLMQWVTQLTVATKEPHM